MPEGPLDIVRQIAVEAEELDRFAQSQPEMDESELYADFARSVFARDKIHPLFGEEVIIYGTPITLSMELEGDTGDLLTRPMAVSASREYMASAGTYAGLTVERVYDAREDSNLLRVVHMVYTGSSPAAPDEHRNKQQTHFYDHILAEGGEVVAYNPVNAHSLVDLRDDPVTDEIDKIAFSEDMDSWVVAEEIGLSVAAALSEREDEDEKNQQRLSYLNSLELLDEVLLITSDFVFGNKRAYETNQTLRFSDTELNFMVDPHVFHFLNGYKRMQSTGAIALGCEPELFIEGSLEDDQTVILPFQGITGGYC